MAPSINPGVSGPLAIISDTDQSGLIVVITALSMCFVLVALAIRVYVRFSNGPWKTDDNILLAATVISCVQSGVVFFEIHKGLGKVDNLVKPQDRPDLDKAYFASNLLYVVVLFLSKASITALYLRLTPIQRHIWAIWGILGASAVWTIMSVLLLTVGCSWNSSCVNSFTRWLTIGIIDMITDVALVLMSVYIIKDLQLRMSQKSIVVGAFSTRVLVIPACALRLYYLSPNTLSTNRSFAISLLLVCTQLQLGYGVMAASIPCLKPFVDVYEKPTDDSTTKAYYDKYAGGGGSGSGTDRSFKMKSLNSAFGRSSHSRSHSRNNSHLKLTTPGPMPATGPLRPDVQNSYTATISAQDQKRKAHRQNVDDDAISVQSQDSRRMIIQRKTDWSVQYDSRSSASKESVHAT